MQLIGQFICIYSKWFYLNVSALAGNEMDVEQIKVFLKSPPLAPVFFLLFSLQVMFDSTSNKCQRKIKHTSSLEMMSRNSPCDHKNQTKDMLKAREYVEAIIQILSAF